MTTTTNPTSEGNDGRAPIEACRFQATEFSVSDQNGEHAKTAPFRMVARSGRPIDHPFWGRVVHDNRGAFVGDRNKIPIDYCHTNDVIGFANKFDVNDDGDLVVSGTLTPGRNENDRAYDVIDKARLGIPWEASINFGGTGIEIEKLGPEDSTEVNGYEFEGPGVVIRKWPLRGVAVVPYGADQFTSTTFDQGDSIAVTIKEFEMSKSIADIEKAMEEIATPDIAKELSATAEAPVEDAVEVEVVLDIEEADEEEQPQEAAAEAPAASAVDSELASRKAEGTKFIDAFGVTAGPKYFADGLSFEDATFAHLKALADENSKLKQKLDAAKEFGESAPVLPSKPAAEAKKKTRVLEDPSW